jgi:succinyl-CoA:acetate CoA-transferase
MAPHVDHTEHDVDIVITERCLTDLRGLAPDERAEALIENCAHPSFREELRSYIARGNRGGGHIPHDLESAYWHLDW